MCSVKIQPVNNKYLFDQPILCMVVGIPASGKTTIARELAGIIVNSAYLSKDLIQSPFTHQERVSGEIYSQIQGPTFNILVNFADTQLSLGKIPIIDAPFSINYWRKDRYSDWVPPFRETAGKYDTRLAIIRCVPPDVKELKRRIKERKYQWDRWKLNHWEDFLEREPILFPIAHDDVYQVVTDQPVDMIIKDVLNNYIKVNNSSGIL
jgi:predicted kinase